MRGVCCPGFLLANDLGCRSVGTLLLCNASFLDCFFLALGRFFALTLGTLIRFDLLALCLLSATT